MFDIIRLFKKVFQTKWVDWCIFTSYNKNQYLNKRLLKYIKFITMWVIKANLLA